MFSVIKNVRGCRFLDHMPDLFVKLTYRRPSNLLKGNPNPCRQFEVMSNRLCSTESDRIPDPLSDRETMYPLNEIQIQELTGNDPQEIKKLRVLQMELAVRNVQHPHYMPARIRLEYWKILLGLTRSAQIKYLYAIKRKEERYSENIVQRTHDETADYGTSDDDCDLFDYKLFRNAMFPLIHPNTISAAMNSRLAEALLFSPPLIMDCGYESVMSAREVKNLCQQMALAINLNRTSRKPYNMVFCNLKKDSLLGNSLWNSIPNIYEEHMPIETTESCYTEMFPKENLVYLTPHCREPVSFNPNDIYIIGGMVDKSNPGPHSLIKAKYQGIRMGSFPIDKYLLWKKGTKSLTIDQVVMVLLQMLQTGDWSQAFNAIPKRKITPVQRFKTVSKNFKRFEF